MLRSILRRANLWTVEIEQCYERLLVEEGDVPRALTLQEQDKWLFVARSRPEWSLVFHYSVVMFDACMSTDEIRGLRLGDINLTNRYLTVPRKSAKVRARARTIELVSSEVLWSFEQLINRAHECGATSPLHYLFPWRRSAGPWDPERSMSSSGIKKQWQEVRRASGILWFRQYDCRHTACSRLAEAGVPVDVIMARGGWKSDRMRQHYTHIGRAAQRYWLEHSLHMRIPPQAHQAIQSNLPVYRKR